MSLKRKKDAQLLPSTDDPLKTCILNLMGEGRSQEEATAWCKDYLELGGEANEPMSIDGANVREAERIMIEAHDALKPIQTEQCIRNRQALFGEREFEAGRRCREDWELGERARGSPIAVATDSESRLQLAEMPESFKRLEQLRLRLDSRTNELINEFHVGNDSRKKHYHYTPEEADRKARKELGLPQVYPKKPEPEATVPDLTGKNKEQLIKESHAADAERTPEKPTTVPNLYGKSHEQVVKEAFAENAAEDKR